MRLVTRLMLHANEWIVGVAESRSRESRTINKTVKTYQILSIKTVESFCCKTEKIKNQ